MYEYWSPGRKVDAHQADQAKKAVRFRLSVASVIALGRRPYLVVGSAKKV